MAFDVGAVIGHAKLDTAGWTAGQKKLSKSFSAIKIGMAGVGAAIIGGLTGSIVAANKFNKEFSNVRTLIDETKVNTSAMKQELLSLDARLGSSIDLTKGLYQALSAGIDAGNAVKFVGESAKFAKAALTDTNTAVDVITTALNAYGKSADQAGEVSDIFFETIKQGKITGQELATTIGSVIPSASKLNIGLDELGASLATMTKQGVNSAEATTQLNALMTAFLKPSKDMQDALQKMGIESGSALLKTEGLSGALKFLEEATGGNEEAYAKLLPNIRAFKGAMALTGDQAEVYDYILGKIEKSAGATDTAFQKQELTFDTLKNTIEKTSIKIGDALLPSIYEMTNGITNFVNSAEGMDYISTAVAGVAASFSVAKDIVMDFIAPIKETFIGVIDSLQNSFAKLSGKTADTVKGFDLLAGTAKIIGITFRLIGKTIELVIEGIVDLILAIGKSGKVVGSFFGLLTGKTSWKEVKSNLKDAGEAFKGFGKNAGENFGDIIDTAKTEFDKLPKEVDSLSKKMSNSWDSVFNKTKKSVAGGMADIKSEIKNSIDDIQKDSEKGGEDLKKNWKDTLKDLGKSFQSGFEQISGIVNYFISAIDEGFNSIADTITMAMDNQLEQIQLEGEREAELLQQKKETAIQTETDRYNQELLIIQTKLNNQQISEQEYNKLKEQFEAQHDKNMEELNKKHDQKIIDQQKKQRKKENEQKKKAFETQKGFNIANVWISAATGIMAAWAGAFQALGGIPFVGPALAATMAGIMSGIILGTAIAQTVLISQQQFTPAATGGTVTKPGMVMTDEAGAEIKKYNTGDLIIPHEISKQIAKGVGAGGDTYNISFAGANIANDMSLKKITDYVIREIGKRVKRA